MQLSDAGFKELPRQLKTIIYRAASQLAVVAYDFDAFI